MPKTLKLWLDGGHAMALSNQEAAEVWEWLDSNPQVVAEMIEVLAIRLKGSKFDLTKGKPK